MEKSTQQEEKIKGLMKQYPTLGEYSQLVTECSKLTGLRAELKDKAILIKANEINDNKQLLQKIYKEVPKFHSSLVSRIKGLEQERDIEY